MVDGMAITPRNGKAVEINAMWYNALRIMESLSNKFKNEYEKTCNTLAEKCYKSFNEKFYNKKKKCLYDVIGKDEIRPNQLFAISLTYPIIDDDKLAVEMFETVKDKLYTKYGLKTLAKGEHGYMDKYEGDNYSRDLSYHNGIIWPWLLGPYYDGLSYLISIEKRKTKKAELENIYKELIEELKETFANLNAIPELYDSTKTGKGAFNQAWSVGEILRILLCE